MQNALGLLISTKATVRDHATDRIFVENMSRALHNLAKHSRNAL